MNKIIQVFYPIIFVIVVALSGGCATTPAAKSESEIYYPKLPTGINTIEEAKQELTVLLKEVYSINYDTAICDFPLGDQGKKLGERYPHMNILRTQLFEGVYNLHSNNFHTVPLAWLMVRKKPGGTIDVSDERIDFPVCPLYYSELTENVTIDVRHMVVRVSHNASVELEDYKIARKIADVLYFIKKNIRKYEDEQLDMFVKKAARYRASVTKPQINEEQRKFIVQANAFTQKNDYAGAIDRYNKAIELDPVSYPAAYFNLALLAAQQNRFKSAARYMEQYLMLVPDAPDARSAQDRIYEWER